VDFLEKIFYIASGIAVQLQYTTLLMLCSCFAVCWSM